MGAEKAAARRSPPLVWAGGLLLLVAAVLGLVGLHRGVAHPPDTSPYRSDTFTTPVDTTLQLAAGGYHLFENTGMDGVRPVTLTEGDIAVTGPDGDLLGLGRPGDRTMTEGEDVYRAVVSFRVPGAGAYHLRVTSSDGGTAQVYVTDDGYRLLLGRDAHAMWPVVLGAFVAAVGAGLLTAGLTKRGAGPGGPAAGWYPDPAAPQHLRWYDGTRWTDYRGTGPPRGSAVRDLDLRDVDLRDVDVRDADVRDRDVPDRDR